jgi:hypothetical protein
VCNGGACTDACSGSLQECNGGCVDRDNDPLNCGDCGNVCDTDQVCVGGECRRFQAVPPATPGDPCDACNGGRCCTYPGDATLTICVNADACPAP